MHFVFIGTGNKYSVLNFRGVKFTILDIELSLSKVIINYD